MSTEICTEDCSRWIPKSLLLVNSSKNIYHSLLFLHYKHGVEFKKSFPSVTGKAEALEKDICFLRETFRVRVHQQTRRDYSGNGSKPGFAEV